MSEFQDSSSQFLSKTTIYGSKLWLFFRKTRFSTPLTFIELDLFKINIKSKITKRVIFGVGVSRYRNLNPGPQGCNSRSDFARRVVNGYEEIGTI